MLTNYLIGSGLHYSKNKTISTEQIMETNKDPIEQLKRLIQEELKDCNHVLWPNVCEFQSTPKGYLRLEEMIIRNVAAEGMSIGSAIAFIEQELAHID